MNGLNTLKYLNENAGAHKQADAVVSEITAEYGPDLPDDALETVVNEVPDGVRGLAVVGYRSRREQP